MANKGLIASIGAGIILATATITSLLGQNNKLENQLKSQAKTSYQNTPEVIPTPMPENRNTQSEQYTQAPLPIPSKINSDLLPQTQLIGYTAENVPVITQHWNQNYEIIPRPISTTLRWAVGARPIIPEWRRVPTGPVLHSQVQWQTTYKPIYTSAQPQEAQPQYIMPAPRPCGPIKAIPAPPIPHFR